MNFRHYSQKKAHSAQPSIMTISFLHSFMCESFEERTFLKVSVLNIPISFVKANLRNVHPCILAMSSNAWGTVETRVISLMYFLDSRLKSFLHSSIIAINIMDVH